MTASEADASAQMALDQALAEAVWAGRRPATLRLYHWPRPALTIGRHQHPADLPCPAVRRLTGGRAIFHEDELTFSVALPAGHPLIRPTVAATYREMAAPILHALAALGLTAARSAEATARGDRFACFAAPTRGEAMLGADKLMGLAQWIGPHGLLAQGSIPLTPPGTLPGAGRHAVIGLSRVLPGITPAALERAVLDGFRARHGVRFEARPPGAAERRRAEHLAALCYAPIMPGDVMTGPAAGRPKKA
ncbi:MAG: hypothetical protein HZA24_01605 [Nitrospirae bacterium]|nr:hypothetical protein [Nitrospirota bacterium]